MVALRMVAFNGSRIHNVMVLSASAGSNNSYRMTQQVQKDLLAIKNDNYAAYFSFLFPRGIEDKGVYQAVQTLQALLQAAVRAHLLAILATC